MLTKLGEGFTNKVGLKENYYRLACSNNCNSLVQTNTIRLGVEVVVKCVTETQRNGFGFPGVEYSKTG